MKTIEQLIRECDWLRRVDQYYNEREKNNESIPSTQGSENNS
jgi:hypothetical protein